MAKRATALSIQAYTAAPLAQRHLVADRTNHARRHQPALMERGRPSHVSDRIIVELRSATQHRAHIFAGTAANFVAGVAAWRGNGGMGIRVERVERGRHRPASFRFFTQSAGAFFIGNNGRNRNGRYLSRPLFLLALSEPADQRGMAVGWHFLGIGTGGEINGRSPPPHHPAVDL